jgi:acetylornithine deacetylase/succinyl-diaminopimelate desuccinylase-like protein
MGGKEFKNNWVIGLVWALVISHTLSIVAQTLDNQEIIALSEAKLPKAIGNLQHFLRLKNDGNYPDQVEQNRVWCDSVFRQLNFETITLPTQGAPLLFAERIVDKSQKSILFYLQIDGQPVDPSAWSQKDPFEPVLKEQRNGQWVAVPFKKIEEGIDPEWRIFGRSTSDSKGPAMSLISALQILQDKEIASQYNIKVIMDFQEELGSPHLPKAVQENRNLLDAEMLFIMDGTRHLSNLPTLTYGARGIATATLTIFGPKYGLHSGQYGNFAPNPVFKAAELIAGLKDSLGRVTLPGFYDGVMLTEKDKALLAKIPENKDSILLNLGLAAHDDVGDTYQEALQYPSLNIRGIKSAWVGKEVRTIIPDEVIVEIDMRLVPETDGAKQMELLRKYILQNGFHIIEGTTPTDEDRAAHSKLISFSYRLGSLPFRTEMDSPIGDFLNKAMNRVFGDKIVNMRTTGGSQPMAPFIKTLNIPAVSIRIPNPDNSIHGPDENIRVGNFKEGIMSCLAILTQKLP